jgi:putative ABC transport system permease protein
MLGIIIGVAAVIALITIVQSVTDSVLSKFSGLGAGTLTVSAQGTSLKKGLTDSDIDSLRTINGVDGVSPSVTMTTTAVHENNAFDKIDLEGKDATYFQHNDVIQYGRAFQGSDMSGNTMICIVDNKFIKNAMLDGQVIGSQVKIDGHEYTVVGIKKTDDSVMASLTDTSNSDGTILIPYRNALIMSGNANVSSLSVYAKTGYDTSQLEKELKSALDNIYNNADNSYSVMNMDSLMATMNSITGMMSTMLAGIASIALLVGGIGIMNMMLVSVSERTKEIGLRKALGAEPFRIQAQFLLESIVLSVCGGIIGAALGLLIAFIAATVLKTPFKISLFAVGLGMGFSGAVGIIFGWMPAKRASELNPIDALRSE